jgi:peptidoglycan/xylan/chitin deacetylase (PgdA/CDA1 family)
MSKLSLLSRNPLVLVVPIVVSLLLIWQQYTMAQPQISVPKMNILPNAGLDELDGRGFPIGWQLSGAETTTASAVKGHNSPTSLLLMNNDNTESNNVTLISPLAAVQAGETYFYKSFYKSNIAFDLLLRSNNQDGTYEQAIVGRYTPSDDWETVGHVFIPSNGTQSVQFIYSISGQGELQVDNAYLEASPMDVYIKPPQVLKDNKIENTMFSSLDGDIPDKWSKYSIGNNQATLARVDNSGETYIRTEVAAYIDGEAKWQYAPIEVKPGQAFVFNVSYQSNAPAKVVAEYTLASGDKKFEIISDLMPIKEWTKYSSNIEVPFGAKDLFVTVILQGNGAINTKGYGLYDTTKPGDISWDEARVSLTFDDGWESAFSSARNLLDKFSYPGTFYLNPSTIDTASFMDSNQVAQLAQSTHEIGSHGYEHINFTTLDRTGIEYQFRRAHDYFEKIHAMQTVNFSAPFGANDAQTSFYARKYYTSLRGTTNGINTRQNFDAYNLRVLYVGKSVSFEKLAATIAEAKDRNGWLILVYHRIDTASSGETTIDPTQFQQQLEIIKKSDVKVRTISTILQEVGVP